MRLTLTTDDGTVLDSRTITRDEWDTETATAWGAYHLLTSLEPGDAEREPEPEPAEPTGPLTAQQVADLTAAGRAAYKGGTSRAPWLCATFRRVVTDLDPMVGDGVMVAAGGAWQAGWSDAERAAEQAATAEHLPPCGHPLCAPHGDQCLTDGRTRARA